MDEYDQGIDPEVRKYFKKIINSFFYGLIWMVLVVTCGIFFQLGEVSDGWKWYNLLFYFLALVTFVWLIRLLLRIWIKKEEKV